MKTTGKLLTILLCLYVPAPAKGQADKGFQVLLTHENDVLAPSNRDENYTGGLKLELSAPSFKLKWQPFLKFSNEKAAIQRFSLGGTAYTPQDLAKSMIVSRDRPYASLTYLGLGRDSYSGEMQQHFSSELLIGGIGLPGPGNFQSYLHRIHFLGSTRPVPQGWRNQVGYNGSLVINYRTKFEKLLYHSHQSLNDELPELLPDYETSGSGAYIKNFEFFQCYWNVAAELGNYMSNLQAGLALNLLNINNAATLNYEPGIPKVIGKTTPVSSIKKIRFNVFINPSFRFVAFNATLQGLMFNDKSIYTIPAKQVQRILFELHAGANLLLFDRIYLRYAFSLRTKEFRYGKPVHNWGGITIGYSPVRWHRVRL